MKNFAKIFTAIVVAFAAYSCIADATEDLGVQVGNGEGQTTIDLSFGELTKVQLGEKAGEVYPLYWSEGDAIAVNGVASNELTGVGENATEAQFIVEGVSYPLNIVYPAPTVTEADVAEEGEAVASYPVVFPAVQQYVPGNVDPKAVVLYGYTAEEPTAPVQLSHLTGVLQLNVKGAVTLTSLTVNARSGNIAGTYNVNCETGALTEVEASNTVTMTFGEGLALNADTATPIYVAVPAGSHGAVWVTLHTATDKMTVKFDSANKPVSAGNVREFKEFYYEANTADEDSEVFEINSVDKLIEFATKAANFFPLTRAVVTADINMTGVEWTPIEGFGAFEFDGGEHTITGLTAPLFGLTNADIHHLTLADVVLNITDNGNSGAFARRIVGGSLRYCSASGTSTIDCSTYDSPDTTNSYFVYSHGGLVGYVNATVIDHCTNDVIITIANNYAGGTEGNTKYKSAIGGIAGSFSDLSSFTNLINNGSITYTGTTQKGTMYISGIVGRDVEGGATTTDQAAAFDHCTNNGDITHSGSSTGGVNLSGIVGFLPAADITCTNLVNNGQVVCKGAATAAYIAGICANTFGANMKDCQNTKTVGIGSGTKNVELAYVAGISGYGITTGKTMDNCDNSGRVVINIGTIALAAEKYACLAGIIGVIRGDDCVIKNCDNSGQVSQKVAASNTSGYLSGSLIGGICAHITGNGSSIQDCDNSGRIEQETITDDTNTSMLAIGGILGMSADKTPCTISGCENTDTGLVVNNASRNYSNLVGTGGIVGILGSGGVVTGCTNRAVVGGKVDCGYLFGMGGVVGATWRGGAKILSCKNYGEVRQTETSLKKGNSSGIVSAGYGLGGVVGLARSTQEISGCENYGTFRISNTNAGSDSRTHCYVGGVIGWYFHQNASDPIDTAAKTIRNCTNYADLTFTGRMGWYYAGGVIGALMTYENANHYWAEISGLKNYGDLNFNPTASAGSNPKHGFGGIIGFTALSNDAHVNHDGKECIALNGCEFYGNITTNGLDHVTSNLGIIMGCERVADLHVAKSSKIGGYIDATIETTTTGGGTIYDPDLEEWIPDPNDPVVTVTTYTGGTALTAENIHTYLYMGGIEADVATADGYTILTERPAAPAVSEQ